MAHRRLRVTRRAVRRLGALVIAVAAIGLAWHYRDRPAAARIEAARNVVGVYTGRSYAWLVRGQGGVALVDTGLDDQATAIMAELAAQTLTPGDVHTVLVTSGHLDHWAAAWRFPNATVYIGAEDVPVLRRERRLEAWGARLFWLIPRTFTAPRRLHEVTGDQVVDVDGMTIRVVQAPGHTRGSLVFLYGDLLFTGDSLVASGTGVRSMPFFRNEDSALNRASLRRLLELPFRRIADGHRGLTEDAREKLRRYLD